VSVSAPVVGALTFDTARETAPPAVGGVAAMTLKSSWMTIVALAATLALAAQAQAANVLAMSYDPSTDQLVLKVGYRGSHDKHVFTVDWEECKDYAFVDAKYQVLGNLVDSEPNDRGINEYTHDVRVSLAGLDCRPVKLTVRTAAGFFRTIIVPARAS
jgi:hypothetical protein